MSCVFSKITVGMVLSLFIFCCISIQAQSCDDGYCDRVIGVDLREGESTSVQWRGQNHTITLLGITQEMGSDVAVVQVDQVSDEIAEGTTSKISGLNVHIPTIFYSGKPGQLGSAALIIGENSMNCHEDCDPTNCPSMIDVWFNSSVYRVGDMGELAIYIFDELGDPMPGEEFNVSYTRNNETVGPSEQTMDPEGYIRTKGTFYDGQEGSYSYHIFISSPVCPYVEDTFSFTVLPNENEIECFDDSDCPSITKRYCEGSNACEPPILSASHHLVEKAAKYAGTAAGTASARRTSIALIQTAARWLTSKEQQLVPIQWGLIIVVSGFIRQNQMHM